MAKTTKKNFELFKKEAERWIKEFGLIGWEIDILHSNIASDHVAKTNFDACNRWATIRLGKDWGETKISDFEMRKTAFRETAEVLLAKLRCMGTDKFVDAREVDEAIHIVIRTLENVLWTKTQKTS